MIINRKKVDLLFTLASFSLLLLIISFILLEYHYTFDPYSWASPGIESVRSRNSWLARRNLYITTGFLSFVLAVVSGIMAYGLRHNSRLP